MDGDCYHEKQHHAYVYCQGTCKGYYLFFQNKIVQKDGKYDRVQ